ncbi:hypothetical protein EVAR_66044_1 [Eumeta japonica]|uniref:Uncharacterized protein n=1 Tax=Eumeta variegata TaxID=151549 RepID=A0A4C2A0P1_EUMVA|nr:hypothetical protein EVAR_66044_1 [Eumeta japonica]
MRAVTLRLRETFGPLDSESSHSPHTQISDGSSYIVEASNDRYHQRICDRGLNLLSKGWRDRFRSSPDQSVNSLVIRTELDTLMSVAGAPDHGAALARDIAQSWERDPQNKMRIYIKSTQPLQPFHLRMQGSTLAVYSGRCPSRGLLTPLSPVDVSGRGPSAGRAPRVTRRSVSFKPYSRRRFTSTELEYYVRLQRNRLNEHDIALASGNHFGHVTSCQRKNARAAYRFTGGRRCARASSNHQRNLPGFHIGVHEPRKPSTHGSQKEVRQEARDRPELISILLLKDLTVHWRGQQLAMTHENFPYGPLKNWNTNIDEAKKESVMRKPLMWKVKGDVRRKTLH